METVGKIYYEDVNETIRRSLKRCRRWGALPYKHLVQVAHSQIRHQLIHGVIPISSCELELQYGKTPYTTRIIIF